jgi:hypothetical protein
MYLYGRYFIVIDDIWDTEAWKIISCAFPENMCGSRVMTTTRIETVARACCSNNIEFVYKMKPLSDQDSRILFFKRIFGSDDACPLYLKQVSVEILKKCGGLPLAVITISSLLANQPNKLKDRWEYVLKSLGSNSEVSPSLIGMRQILNLSYTNLPHNLKTCMLYLGIYPEDYTIDKNDLTRQWIAQGFITKAHGIDPEDVAKSYFNELINRSMIQPSDVDDNGEVMSGRVHDMMLDLILHKSKEENFITVLDDIQDMEGQSEKIRRLSLHLDGPTDERVVESVLSQVRMLARFGTSAFLPCFLLFKHLRVLTIEISEGSRSSSSFLDFTGICHLLQLRYIKIIASSDTIKLPKKIGCLHQLETFHIETSIHLPLELPTDIVHMNWLLHLIIPNLRLLADGIGSLKSLRTLCCWFVLSTNSRDHIKALGELTNLTNLDIRFEEDDSDNKVEGYKEVVCTCLEKLCNLKRLDIGRADCSGFCLDVPCVISPFCHLQRLRAPAAWFSRVPEWIGQQQNLYDLQLTVKELLEDDVRILAQLPSLTHLNLYIKGALKDKILIHGGRGFPVLKHFEVYCSRISHLNFEAGAMPKLERLELGFNVQGWDKYDAAPTGIEHLSCLKEIYACIAAKESNKSAAQSALRDAANMHSRRLLVLIRYFPPYFPFDGMDLQPEDDDRMRTVGEPLKMGTVLYTDEEGGDRMRIVGEPLKMGTVLFGPQVHRTSPSIHEKRSVRRTRTL